MKLAFAVFGSLALLVLPTAALSVLPDDATQAGGTTSDVIEARLNLGYEDAIVEPRQKVKVPSTPGAGAWGRAQKFAEFTQHIMNIINSDPSEISGTQEQRGKWTKATVEKLHKDQPQFNWVVCYPKHKINFDGKEGEDWGHTQKKIFGHFQTFVYDIYWFKKGTFERFGDGGWQNWAYMGNVISRDGGTVKFGPPF